MTKFKGIALIITVIGCSGLIMLAISLNDYSEEAALLEQKIIDKTNELRIENEKKEQLEAELEAAKLKLDIAAIDQLVLDKDIGYVIYIPSSDETYSYNPTNYYLAASTIKVSIAMLLIDMEQNGEINFSDDVLVQDIYRKEEEEDDEIEEEEEVFKTVETLIKEMIIHSDNLATGSLLEFIGVGRTYKVIVEDTNNNYDEETRTINAIGGINIIKKVVQEKYSWIYELMGQTSITTLAATYVPRENLNHKYGSYEMLRAEIGVIHDEQNEVYFSVYCNEGTEVCQPIISEFTKIIYEDVINFKN